jgi:addiction module HigA family antidote
MPMFNPMHPGEFIVEVYLKEHHISGRELAEKLDVAPSTLNRILKGTSGITPEMALRLSKALSRSAESWLQMQQNYDLWHARRKLDLKRVSKLKLKAA